MGFSSPATPAYVIGNELGRAGICLRSGAQGYAGPVLGSILTRQYRFATRGIQFTLQTARVAVDIAEGVVGEVAGRLGLHNGHDEPDVVNGTVVPDAEPRPEPPEPRPAPRAEPAPPSPAAPHGDPVAGSPAASSPAPPASAASPAP